MHTPLWNEVCDKEFVNLLQLFSDHMSHRRRYTDAASSTRPYEKNTRSIAAILVDAPTLWKDNDDTDNDDYYYY